MCPSHQGRQCSQISVGTELSTLARIVGPAFRGIVISRPYHATARQYELRCLKKPCIPLFSRVEPLTAYLSSDGADSR